MKTLLMHPNRDFDPDGMAGREPRWSAQDIELGVLLEAAAKGDSFVRKIMVGACAEAWVNDTASIRHRQEVLRDCLASPEIVRRLYAIAIEPFSRERSWDFSLYGRDPSAMVASSVRTLRSSLLVLRRLRDLCLTNAARFPSPGFQRLFAALRQNLDDAYLEAAGHDLDTLTFRKGLLLSARVGDGGKGIDTMLRRPERRDLGWLPTAAVPGMAHYTLRLEPRDEAGARAFAELQNRGLSVISDALYQSAGHVLGFLAALRIELAFYIGCLNLSDRLAEIGETVSFPEVSDAPERFLCRNLRDACLALTMGRRVVGNDVDANGRPLVIITGANRGGKSTFLRSVGIAQMMAQAGMFVTADAYVSSRRSGLFTHFKRAEDRTMQSGKFDEELVRLSAIADRIHRGALVLFNESFAATNEREGSEIAREVVSALLENDVTVFFVSHMYAFARAFLGSDHVLFLRAERKEDGTRSFRLRAGEPAPRSFATDLYRQIFSASLPEGAVHGRAGEASPPASHGSP